MSAIVDLGILVAISVAAYGLVHKLIPWIVRRIGQVLGFRMRTSPLTQKRISRFKSIRRGYWSFVLITTGFALSFFLELFVNNKAVYIRYGDRTQYPAVASWVNFWLPAANLDDTARASDYGLTGDAELNYRHYARWVRDPGELERDAREIEAQIERDAEAFRDRLADQALRAGLEFDRSAPLPQFKLDQYDIMRERAALYRRLQSEFEKGEASIVMPLHSHSPREQVFELPGQPPHKPFQPGVPPLGTDFEGKDVLAQILYGFRISFAFAAVVAFVGYSIGVVVGAVMGFFGGWVDILVQRIIEVWSSIPFLYVMMILASVTQPEFWLLCLMLVVLNAWLGITYYVRGEFYREKARDYVQAASALGVLRRDIMLRHILPNALVPIVTYLPFAIVAFINVLVSLDFLGFGLPVDEPSWGRLLRQGSENVVNFPHMIYFPVMALALTLYCVVMIGEAVREAFDPQKYARIR
jgi:microcin C transport system permease protein